MNPLDHVLKGLQARRAKAIETNGAGGAQDWPDYKRRIGFVQGIEAAMDEIQDAKRQLQRTGDLDSEA